MPAWKIIFSEHFIQDAARGYIYSEQPVGSQFEGAAFAFKHKSALEVTVDVFYLEEPNVLMDPIRGALVMDGNGD